MICEWCKTNSGRTHAKRDCCLLRALAQAPKHALLEHVKTLTETEKTQLRIDLIEEKARLRSLRK